MCSLLRKNIKRAKGKKVWTKKRKENNNNSKREEKRREMEHIRNTQKLYCLCCLFLVCVSIATFHTCFTPLFVTIGARNTYRPATRTSDLDIYSILLSVLTCVPHMKYFSLCAFQAPHILQISTEKTLAIFVSCPQVSRTSHLLYRPLLCIGKNLVRTW